MALSRRQFVTGSLIGCCGGLSTVAFGDVLATNLQPLVGQHYAPVDPDERGLWHACGLLEEQLQESDLVLKEPDLQEYTVSVVERLIARPATDLRIYIVRDPSFNASMAPNGLMIVHTGFLARVHNEAQFASVLGHEAGHYFRKHSVEGWRNRRTKTAVMAFVGATTNLAAGYAATQGYSTGSWYDLANAINQNLLLSIFSFSRSQESEADAYGIGLLARAQYSALSAAEVWQQVIDEQRSSAAQRDKKYRDSSTSAYSTHPPSEERMIDLAETAASMSGDVVVQSASDGRESWEVVVSPHFSMLLDEQVKLNNPGASLYLIERYSQFGWSGVLRYQEGEVYRLRGSPGDDARAADAYAASTRLNDAPPEAWRAHGYALIKANRKDEGRAALSRYLELKPQASDAAMVQFSLNQ
jgi:Zn-dependent protease with chaperone function